VKRGDRLKLETISGSGGTEQTNISHTAVTNLASGVAAIMGTNDGSQTQVRYITQTRPAIGDTNYFGPWTPGTTTAGIQEAWDSVAKPTNAGPVGLGVKFQFDSGYYYLTNPIVFSNYWPLAMVFDGASLYDTAIVYAGSLGGTNMLTFRGAGTPRATSLNIPLHLDMRNLRFSAINDNTNILVHVQDYSYAKIENCNFEGWQSMTNQIEGAGVSLSDASAWATNGNLVGIKFQGPNEHSTILDNVFFAALATGVHAANDHVSAFSLKFARVGRRVTKWPATSIYSMGACIIRENGLDSDWWYLHMYNSKLGFLSGASQLDRPKLHHANFEDMDNYTAVLDSTRGIELDGPVFYDVLESQQLEYYKNNYCFVASNSPNYGLTDSPNIHSTMHGYDAIGSSLVEIIGTNVVKKALTTGTTFNGSVALGVSTTTAGPITVNDGLSGNTIQLDASPTFGLAVANANSSQYVLATPEGTLTASAGITSEGTLNVTGTTTLADLNVTGTMTSAVVRATSIYPLGATNAYLYADATGKMVGTNNGAGLTNLPISSLQGAGGAGTPATNGTAGQVLSSAANGGVYWATSTGAAQTNIFASNILTNGGVSGQFLAISNDVVVWSNAPVASATYPFQGAGGALVALGGATVRHYSITSQNLSGGAGGFTAVTSGLPLSAPYTLTNFHFGLFKDGSVALGSGTNVVVRVYTNGVLALTGTIVGGSADRYLTPSTESITMLGGGFTNLFYLQYSNTTAGVLTIYPFWHFQAIK
jgi:hypothetical protein